MSILEIIIYSLIGSAIVMYLIYKLFIKPKKKNKQPKNQNKIDTETDND